MNLVQWRITSADPVPILDQLGRAQIPLFQVAQIDELHLTCYIPNSQVRKFLAIAEKKGAAAEPISRKGFYWVLLKLLRRPILIGCFAMLMALSLLLQTRIFFVEVEGNAHLEDAQILEAAADCGIRFGATRRDIRSEEVKNKLLEQIPQLRWIGVNTYGCRAVISVRERNIREEISDAGGISSIAASCDGIITGCTVTQGTPMVSVGQAVRAGQILISGFTDCGITIRATRAQGDVFALTQHKISLSTPKISSQRQLTGEKTTRFSLTLGKKRINFYKGSGISPGSCVKMYARYVLTLPGGFQLPVALTKETVLTGQLVETSREISEDFFQTFADD